VRDFLLANYSRLFGEDTTITATNNATPAPSSPNASGGGGEVLDVHRDAKLIGLYGGLLNQSRNFFTRRQSLKLLAELLLDRTNFNIMMKFISSRHNLKLVMNL
jgi:hypothetical protein